MGSKRKVKDIYVASSFDELLAKCQVKDQPKPDQALKSIDKLMNKGLECYNAGDEEQGFILLMRGGYICDNFLKTKSSLLPKKKKIEEEIGLRYKKIIPLLEQWTESLPKRYSKTSQEVRSLTTPNDEPFALSHKKKTFDLTEDINANPKTYITCRELYNLIQKNAFLMILDVRPAKDYGSSHILWHNILNIPEEFATPGKTAQQIRCDLGNLVTDSAWKNRLNVEFLVLLDWYSSKDVKSNSPLDNLKLALSKWDPNCKYKSKPLMLDGGMRKWLSSFPTLTSNPRPEVPAEYKSSIKNINLDFDYPSLDTPEPVPPLSDVAISVDDVQIQVVDTSTNRDGVTRPTPLVDRNKKPSSTMRAEVLSSKLKKPLVNDNTGEQQALDSEQITVEVPAVVKDTVDLPMNGPLSEPANKKEKSSIDSQSNRKYTSSSENGLPPFGSEPVVPRSGLNSGLGDGKSVSANKVSNSSRNTNDGMEFQSGPITRLKPNEEETLSAAEKKRQEELKRLREERKAREAQEMKRLNDELDVPSSNRSTGITRAPLRDEFDDSSRKSGGGLKRSHSSPNINDLLPEKSGFRNQTISSQPSFDRTLKPHTIDLISARQRNFCQVWGDVVPGLTGLKNLGNTCYMNATIQCLSNTPILSQRLADPSISAQINSKSKITKGEIAAEVAAVLRQLWNGKCRSIACKDLKLVVGKYEKNFRGSEQQDAQEFLISLMNWLHEDLNRVRIKQMIRERNFESMEEREAADLSWRDFQSQNDSAMTDLFFGLYRSTVTCVHCCKKSVTFDAFSDLSVPIPASKNKCTIEECLKLFLQDESISGWNCPQCKEKRDAVKKIDLWRLPPILVIYLKRFYHEGFLRRKLQNYVDFPLENLDLEYFVKGPRERKSAYDLQCVCNHIGTMDGGHYTSYCRNIYQSNWYKFDDHEVYEISRSHVVSSSAYILFYSSPQLLTRNNFP